MQKIISFFFNTWECQIKRNSKRNRKKIVREKLEKLEKLETERIGREKVTEKLETERKKTRKTRKRTRNRKNRNRNRKLEIEKIEREIGNLEKLETEIAMKVLNKESIKQLARNWNIELIKGSKKSTL